jgi:type IV secretion system protein VirB2
MSSQRITLRSVLLLFAAAAVTTAHATTTGLPWEGPLTTLKDSLTGPVAGAIALISFVVCGGLMLFNKGEMGDFAKYMILLILILSGFFLGASILTVLFGFTAAVL